MAKVTYTAIVSDISGSLAGSTFKRTKSGGIILNKPRPRQTKTTAQYDKRRILLSLSQNWQTLSTTNKELWNEYASLSNYRQSGYNAFLQLNIRLLAANNVNLTQKNAPPPNPQTPTAITGLSKYYFFPTWNQISWTAPLSGSYFTQVYYTVPVMYTMTNKENWQLLGTTTSSLGWMNHYHDYPTPIEIFYYARTIDLYGRVSPRTEKI